jgi:hypothetical protein
MLISFTGRIALTLCTMALVSLASSGAEAEDDKVLEKLIMSWKS